MRADPRNPRPNRAWLALACALALPLAPVAARAEPPSDPLQALLAERGLLAPGPNLAARLRDRASEMVVAAMTFVGVPYRLGGNGDESGFDCSGFTRHVFALGLGLVLPRRVDEQAGAPGLVGVDRSALQPGDLVFFNTLKRSFSHVGIYIGEGRFIHAPRSGSEVRIEDMRQSYWAQRFTGARRAALTVPSATPESTLPPSQS